MGQSLKGPPKPRFPGLIPASRCPRIGRLEAVNCIAYCLKRARRDCGKWNAHLRKDWICFSWSVPAEACAASTPRCTELWTTDATKNGAAPACAPRELSPALFNSAQTRKTLTPGSWPCGSKVIAANGPHRQSLPRLHYMAERALFVVPRGATVREGAGGHIGPPEMPVPSNSVWAGLRCASGNETCSELYWCS